MAAQPAVGASQPEASDSEEPVICVYANGNGSFRVDVDPDLAQDVQGGPDDEGQEGGMQSVQAQSAGQVLQIIRSALSGAGQAQYSKGFNDAAQGKPQRAPM